MGGPLRAVLTQDDGVVVSLCREPSYSIAPTIGTTRTPARQQRFLRSLTTQQIGRIKPAHPQAQLWTKWIIRSPDLSRLSDTLG
jgi:hypothetical protein